MEIFIARTLEQCGSVCRIKIIIIGKCGTLQTVRSIRSHIYIDMIIGSLFHKVVIIEEPSYTGILSCGITVHEYPVGLHFFLKSEQLLLFFCRERSQPIPYHSIKHIGVRYSFFRRVIYIRSSVESRQLVSFIIVPTSTSEEIHQGFRVSLVEFLRPRCSLKHLQHIHCVRSAVYRISPYKALHTVTPSGTVGGKSFSPERIGICGLRCHADAASTDFRQQIYHRNRAIHSGYWQQ